MLAHGKTIFKYLLRSIRKEFPHASGMGRAPRRRLAFAALAATGGRIEAGGPVCKTTSSARRKHLGGSCSPPFLPDHGPVTQSSLPPSLTCPPIGSGISLVGLLSPRISKYNATFSG